MRRLHLPKALLLLAVFAAGCRTQVPSLFLQVEDPSAILPTQLRVTVRVQGMDTTTIVRPENPGAPLQSPQTMRLILPDATVGHTAQLTVEGIKDGAVAGMALVSAAVVLGAETQVTVSLVPQTTCPGGICACNVTTCPSGCCQGDTCTAPGTNACGTGGDACMVCPTDTTDRCVDGACRCGADAPCPDGFGCQSGLCQPTSVPGCTLSEQCTTPPGQCFESVGLCQDGLCTYTAKEAGAACNDGDSCTDGDACNGAGSCVGNARTCTTPGSACHEATGSCVGGNCSYAQLPENTACDDGNACTTGDVCNGAGACGGTAIVCNSPPSQCHQATGTCSNGVCTYALKAVGTACNDGNACTTGDVCNALGGCAGTAMTCSSPPSQCHQATGTCSGGTCSYALKSAGSACDDGNACTTGDVCSAAGTCSGTATTCNSPPSQCHQATGTCSGGTCNYALKAAGSSCNDGNACTTGDVCNAAGTCSGTAMVCNNPPSQCHQSSGSCSGGTCSYPLKAAGSACNDGNSCTTGDVCNAAGTCSGTAMVCNSPPSQCHQSSGTCSGGTCSYPLKAAGSACNDGNACTTGDVCNAAGTCSGTAMVCNNPPSQCHQPTGTCSGGTCSYTLKAAGSACNDGNECTVNDACTAAGACVGTNAPVFTQCSQYECGRCQSGQCVGGCGPNQMCCWGYSCQQQAQFCPPEP